MVWKESICHKSSSAAFMTLILSRGCFRCSDVLKTVALIHEINQINLNNYHNKSKNVVK